MGFGPPARNIGKNSSQDWSRNWPCRENREKIAQNPGKSKIFPIFSLFSRQGQFRDRNLGSFFFSYETGRRPETHFLPGQQGDWGLQGSAGDCGCLVHSGPAAEQQNLSILALENTASTQEAGAGLSSERQLAIKDQVELLLEMKKPWAIAKKKIFNKHFQGASQN